MLSLMPALAVSLGVQAGTAEAGTDRLFPAGLPTAKWSQFQPEGSTAPVTGVIYRKNYRPVCGAPIGVNFRLLGGAAVALKPKGKLILTTLNGLFPLFHSVKDFLAGAAKDPTARVTITQRISRDVRVTYSRNLSKTEEPIVILEYDLTKDISLVAMQDERGGYGLDFRIRRRFR